MSNRPLSHWLQAWPWDSLWPMGWFKLTQTWKEKCTFEVPSLLLLLGSLQATSCQQTQVTYWMMRNTWPSTLAARQATPGLWGRPCTTSCPQLQGWGLAETCATVLLACYPLFLLNILFISLSDDLFFTLLPIQIFFLAAFPDYSSPPQCISCPYPSINTFYSVPCDLYLPCCFFSFSVYVLVFSS